MEDEAILTLYFARDPEAIAETEKKYGTFCTTIARNILTLREDAEECLNDVLHAVWNRIPPLRPENMKAFLGRLTRNAAIDRYRREHAQKRYAGMELLLSELNDCVPSPDTAEQTLERKELGERISDWLDALPDEDCALFVRRYWHGEAVKTLARKCGISPNAMSHRLSQLRKELRHRLESEGVQI